MLQFKVKVCECNSDTSNLSDYYKYQTIGHMRANNSKKHDFNKHGKVDKLHKCYFMLKAKHVGTL